MLILLTCECIIFLVNKKASNNSGIYVLDKIIIEPEIKLFYPRFKFHFFFVCLDMVTDDNI